MLSSYESVLSLARAKGYHAFTELQEKAFSEKEVLESERDIFVLGETSSGKTLIPILMYDYLLQQARENNLPVPKMLFVVPYRALASQKMREIQSYFKNEALTIVQSTGEFRQDDAAVQNGNVDIAVVITEKAYRYASRKDSFLTQYDLLVLDEIGLINSADRGSRLDFLFTWAKELKVQCGRPRTVALGTPFYNWGSYIRNYHFLQISGAQRPIHLTECPVHYSEYGILSVAEGNHPLQRTRFFTAKQLAYLRKNHEVVVCECEATKEDCPYDEACRHDAQLICDKIGAPCVSPVDVMPEGVSSVRDTIIERICRWYIARGKQVLIFMNNRETVRTLCLRLYHLLEDILPEAPEESVCKQRVLESCNLEEEDAYGILEPGHYKAFCSGIGFHSAGMPNELRAYVENKLLECREMKVVCSTETLAFGVNSTVDVVVIADIVKQDNALRRYLSLNEYKNYVGRAGRLQKLSEDRYPEGYVYPLIKDENVLVMKSKKKINRISQKQYWETLQETTDTPVRLYSHFYDADNKRVPFFLLNLFSTDHKYISLPKLMSITEKLPRPASCPNHMLKEKYDEAIRFLLEQNLIVRHLESRARRRGESETNEEVYSLTPLGAGMRGYVLSTMDYLLVCDAVNAAIRGRHIEKEILLYHILCSEYLDQGLSGISYVGSKRLAPEELFEFFVARLGDRMQEISWLQGLRENEEENLRIYYLLAAMICWSEGNATRSLFDRFGVLYPILQKIAERVAYFLEIAAEVLPAVLEKRYRSEACREEAISYDEAVDCLSGEIHQMFYAVSYGINIGVHAELTEFLSRQPEQEAQDLAARLTLSRIEPKDARLLRRIGVRYYFYEHVGERKPENKEQYHNLKNQKEQYRKDISRMGPYIVRFFDTKFEKQFRDTDENL